MGLSTINGLKYSLKVFISPLEKAEISVYMVICDV